jgi:hypothetical protein
MLAGDRRVFYSNLGFWRTRAGVILMVAALGLVSAGLGTGVGFLMSKAGS